MQLAVAVDLATVFPSLFEQLGLPNVLHPWTSIGKEALLPVVKQRGHGHVWRNS